MMGVLWVSLDGFDEKMFSICFIFLFHCVYLSLSGNEDILKIYRRIYDVSFSIFYCECDRVHL